MNNKTIERLDLSDPNGVAAGSFYYAKGLWPNAPYANHKITYLVGVRAATSSTITLAYASADGSVPGAPAIDDTPTGGEVLGLSAMTPPNASSTTVTSVGGTQAYGTNQVVTNVASASMSDQTSTTIGFAYAPGVGFTSITSSGTTTLMTQFSINATSSQSVRQIERVTVGPGDASSAMRDAIARLF